MAHQFHSATKFGMFEIAVLRKFTHQGHYFIVVLNEEWRFVV